MKKSVLAASVLTLAACATTTTTDDPIYPSSGNVVNVYVVIDRGQLYAYPELVVVKNKNTSIVWHIAGPSQYTFDDIEIKDPDNRGEFNDCTTKSGKKGTKVPPGYSFICVSNNNLQGAKPARHYKYTIKVAGAPSIPPLDPWVVND